VPETKVSHASSLYAAACTHFHQAATILTALSGQSSDENVRAASFLSLLSFLSHTEARPPLFICSPVLLFCLFATTFRHPGVGNDSRVQDELRSDALAGRRSPAPGNRPSSVRFPRPPAFPYCQGHLNVDRLGGRLEHSRTQVLSGMHPILTMRTQFYFSVIFFGHDRI